VPITFERDDVRRRLVATVTGDVTGADLRAVMDRQVADGLWQCDHLSVVFIPRKEPAMSKVVAIMSMSLDGYVADRNAWTSSAKARV
jgi:hypothetical protein